MSADKPTNWPKELEGIVRHQSEFQRFWDTAMQFLPVAVRNHPELAPAVRELLTETRFTLDEVRKNLDLIEEALDGGT